MSDVSELDLRDTLARIDRARAETVKFIEEAEKLRAEAGKPRRERITLVISSGAAILLAGAAIGGLVVSRL